MDSILSIIKAQGLKLAVITVFGALLLTILIAGNSSARRAGDALAAKRAEWARGEGAFFVRKDCVNCHSISAFGINGSRIGPDLSIAVTDVEARFGKTLEQFLDNPNGTMSIVLARNPLSAEEKREAVELLKTAYQKRLAQAGQAVPSGARSDR